jgi:predicted nucleic acid-binding protein
LNLARIGRLDLLPGLYRQVLIPSAVAQELETSLRDLPFVPQLASLPWLVIGAPQDSANVQRMRADLDAGEAEAIVLALERHADLLLVDERRGRRIAIAAGLRVMGLLGVIAAAKNKGLIDAAKPVIDELIQ